MLLQETPWGQVAGWAVTDRLPTPAAAPDLRGRQEAHGRAWGSGRLAVGELLLAARAWLAPVEIGYRKGGGAEEVRRGWPEYLGGSWVAMADADRGAKPRRFSIENISWARLAPGSPLLHWDDCWTLADAVVEGAA